MAHDGNIDRWHVVRIANDYTAEHPVWHFGHADLDEWHLSPALRARLEAWADYWQQQMDWEHGWIPGSREQWFEQERRALPQDLAAELGPAFLVVGELEAVRSETPPTNPAAARAVERIAATEHGQSTSS